MPTDERTSQSEANKQKDNVKSRSTEFSNKNDPNFDPSRQNEGIDPGKPSNPNTPTQKDTREKKDLHPVVATDDRLRHSGKHVGGLPNEPVVTLNPTSKNVVGQQNDYETKQITDVQSYLLSSEPFDSDYDNMEVGDGLLISIYAGKTIDQVIYEAQKKVSRLNELYSVPYLNAEGEEVSDQVIVHEFKRNDDQTVQLDANSRPITNASHQILKKRIQIRQYVAKSAIKDDKKISSDGALIVRVF